MIKHMKISAILAISMALAGNAQANTLLHGTIKDEKNAYLVDAPTADSCHGFPDKMYIFPPIKVYGLSYDKTVPQSRRIKDLNGYLIDVEVYIKLISYDEKTKVSQFKLFLKGGSDLYYTGNDFEYNKSQSRNIQLMNGDGKIKLADGSPAEFMIEGKHEIVNGKIKWISFNKNKYFDITAEKGTPNPFTHCKYQIRLVSLQDSFPVVVSN